MFCKKESWILFFLVAIFLLKISLELLLFAAECLTSFSELIREGIGDNKQTEKRTGLASPRLGDARWFSVFKRQRCLASFCFGSFPLSSGLSSGSELPIVRGSQAHVDLSRLHVIKID